MPLLSLPHSDLFDSVEPLGSSLEQAGRAFFPTEALSASLPSLMMWQNEFAYFLTRKGPLSWILGSYGKNVFGPVPPFPFTSQTLGFAFDYMSRVNGPGQGVSRVEGLNEVQCQEASAWGFPTRPTLTEYLYDGSKVAGLQGDPYRAKRAEVNHLLRSHSVVLRPYRKDDLEACGELFETWKSQRHSALKGTMGQAMLRSAQKAHFLVLREGEEWGMQAWVVLVDGRLAAYCAGAALSSSTFGIFLEVADLTVKGLSAYIFASVCRQLGDFPFINAGDAEGLPGLAGSKEHWHPVRKLELFAADPKN